MKKAGHISNQLESMSITVILQSLANSFVILS